MNEDTIADLKQFIATTVSQQFADVATKDDIARLEQRFDGVDNRFDGLEKKVDDIQSSIADALDTSNEAFDTELKDHERRITTLETKAA